MEGYEVCKFYSTSDGAVRFNIADHECDSIIVNGAEYYDSKVEEGIRKAAELLGLPIDCNIEEIIRIAEEKPCYLCPFFDRCVGGEKYV